MTSSLPPIDSSLIPADVRKGGAEDQKLYATALQFESELTRQLSQSLTASVTDTGDDDSGDGSTSSDAATNTYAQMLPDALAKSIESGGGLGLAPQLYAALKEKTSK
jgi:Rod binding domain-containing protein